MTDHKISCRVEEVPTIAELLRKSFMRDQQLFAAFSPIFNNDYLIHYDTLRQVITDLVGPHSVTDVINRITSRIESYYITARNLANKVEFYARQAGNNLTIKPSDFGIKSLRKVLSHHDNQGTIQGLHEILYNIHNNRLALQSKGMTPELQEEFARFTTNFELEILTRANKIKERSELVTKNVYHLNSLWGMVTEICEAGQIIAARQKNKTMKHEYVLRNLLKMVRSMPAISKPTESTAVLKQVSGTAEHF